MSRTEGNHAKHAVPLTPTMGTAMNKRVRTSVFERRFLALLPVGVVSIVVACGGAQHVDTSSTPLSVAAARAQFASSLDGLRGRKNVRDVKFTRLKATYKADRGPEFTDGTAGQTDDYWHKLALLQKLAYEKDAPSHVTSDGQLVETFWNEAYAAKFVDALIVLREAASTDTEPADFAAFTVAANAWLTTTPKPEMSDEVRTYKLLAEDAVRRKDFSAALDAYRTGLMKDPMWPEGQYNAALLAAEAEDYEAAANYMRRYLVLAPDAKDAPAARDNLLVWQHKAKQ